MYLTRVLLNPHRPHTKKSVANPNAMHGRVMAAYPPGRLIDEHGNRTGVPHPLWRVDLDRSAHRLYVAHAEKPDVTSLVEDCGWPDARADTVVVADMTPLLDNLAVGDEYEYRLTANVTAARPYADMRKRVVERDGERLERLKTRRVPAQNDGERIAWLVASKGDANGFAVKTVDEVSSRTVRFTRGRGNGNKPVILDSTDFAGRLLVTDPERLRAALTAGIGHAKAYGCGLLTLAPVSS